MYAQCDQWKVEGNQRKDGLDYYDCAPTDVAFCAGICSTALTTCVKVEKLYGRDGAACVAVQ
jgi:hypothetical protein